MFRFLVLMALSAILSGCDNESELPARDAVSFCSGRDRNLNGTSFILSDGGEGGFCRAEVLLKNPAHVKSTGIIGGAEIAVTLDVEAFEPNDPELHQEALVEVCDIHYGCCVEFPPIGKENVGHTVETVVTGMYFDSSRRFEVRLVRQSGFQGTIRFSGAALLSRTYSDSPYSACGYR